MSTFDPTVRTSRVFEATLAVFDALRSVSLPNGVSLYLFRDPTWEDVEYVVVETNNDPTTNEWIQSGPAAREERMVIDVLIRMLEPETDHDDPNEAARRVIERLETIADVVQSIAFDVVEGKPKEIGFANERKTGRVVPVNFTCEHSSEGVVGKALVSFALVAQI